MEVDMNEGEMGIKMYERRVENSAMDELKEQPR